jgi:PAS domain S-box-containing protein
MHAPQAPGISAHHANPWAILDALHHPCTLLNASGAIVYANAAAWQLNGSRPAIDTADCRDFLTHHSGRLALTPADAAELAAALHDVLSGARATADLRYSYQAGDQQRWLATTISAYDGEAAPAALVQHQDVTECKQTEDRLRLYERALEAVSAGVVISDQQQPDQPLVYCNPAFERISGYSRAEIIGRNCRMLQGDDTDRATVDTLRAAIQAGSACEVVLKNYRKDGSPFWNALQIAPIRDEQQRITHFVSMHADVSERKQVEAALHEADDRFRFLSEATFEGLAIHDNGRIIDANQALATIYGYEHDDMIGLSVLDLIAPEVRANITNRLPVDDKPYETIGLRKDGSRLPIEVHSKQTCYRGRELRVASVRDITDRKRAEEAIQHVQTFLNSVIENIPLMLIVKDAKDLRFVRFNKAGEELIGLSREEMIGRNDYDFFPADEADFFTSKDREVLNSRKVVDIPEEPLQTRHHGLRMVHTRKIPILDEHGEPEYLLAIAEDITDRKEAEMALQASEARYQKMIANMPGMVYQFMLHPDGAFNFTLVSEGVREVLGLTPEALLSDGALLMRGLAQEDQEAFSKSFHDSVQTLQPWNWEGRITCTKGEQRWIQGISRPERQDDGTIVWDGVLLDITERKQAAEALRLSEVQAEMIRAQAAVLEEISTPIFPISANVVMMPLIGTLDTARARQMIETLLEGVQAHQARIVIVDITGVPVVDTQVANVLIQAAQAVRLLGAQIVITGIRPEIAQTLVSLGIDLSSLTTRGSLQSGVAYALERR